MGITLIKMMTYKKLKSNKIINASQDDNRKQMLLFATIYFIASTLLFTLIY